MRASCDLKAGEHLSIMYTHSLWATWARRDHLANIKHFWCKCERCEYVNRKIQTDPSAWVCNVNVLHLAYCDSSCFQALAWGVGDGDPLSNISNAYNRNLFNQADESLMQHKS